MDGARATGDRAAPAAVGAGRGTSGIYRPRYELVAEQILQLIGDLALHPGDRPDLSVDGTIELQKLTNIVKMSRPAFGQENSSITIFKLTPDGAEAVRTPVKLGRAAVTEIEIVDGLKAGDQVILSDMSQYDQYDRVRIR